MITAFTRYKKMGDALRKTNRPIVYSICEMGTTPSLVMGKGCRWSFMAHHSYNLAPSGEGREGGLAATQAVDAGVDLSQKFNRWIFTSQQSALNKQQPAQPVIISVPAGTTWHTQWKLAKPAHPHHLKVDLPEVGAF